MFYNTKVCNEIINHVDLVFVFKMDGLIKSVSNLRKNNLI